MIAYVHSLGLKFGIYSCAGSHTCGGRPASYGYEEVDARTFAAWGVDYLKYDFCFVPPGTDGRSLYQRMGQALRASGRDIVFSLCEWGLNKPWQWAGDVGGHLWRTTGDIEDSWASIIDIGFNRQMGLEAYAGPGRWNDPDMLVVGMYGKGNVAKGDGGCSSAEYRSHFSLWCLLAAPLMIGCDVRAMNDMTRAILGHEEIIAINQDVLGSQGYCVGQTMHGGGLATVYAKPLADGDIAVGLFNLGDHNQQPIPLGWETLGLHPERPCRVRDLWTRSDLGRFRGTLALPVDSHDVALLRLSPE